nr:2-C-methyl-D-erythritol 4-phosphate cytidylyltransferase [Bacteroidota bacterium]
MKFNVIIPASGSGERFRTRIPKQFFKLNGKELITYTIRKFNSINSVESIVIATKKEYFKRLHKIIKDNKFQKVIAVVLGGATRHDSVFNGLKVIIP